MKRAQGNEPRHGPFVSFVPFVPFVFFPSSELFSSISSNLYSVFFMDFVLIFVPLW
jgi:hypothetical protein